MSAHPLVKIVRTVSFNLRNSSTVILYQNERNIKCCDTVNYRAPLENG